MKTVFFGPYVGEFGWELLYWHGWIRELSRTVFKGSRRIVASFPGRYPFYPEADEFWAHPAWFLQKPISARGYITDFWRNGLPLGNVVRKRFRYLFRPYVESVPLSSADRLEDVETRANALLAYYREKLPEGTQFIVPFRLNHCPRHGVKVGMEIADRPTSDGDFKVHRVGFEYQVLEQLRPTPTGTRYFEERRGGCGRLIAIFPRARSVRRPDKNWPREKYDRLIGLLRRKYPENTVAILGEPGGAYYSDGVPEGCIDLINVDKGLRMDVQIAALGQCDLAIGGMSGAMLFALACGCPGLIVGMFNERDIYFRENYLDTHLVYYPFMDADPEEVFQLACGMIEGAIPPRLQQGWDPTQYFGWVARIKGRLRQVFSP